MTISSLCHGIDFDLSGILLLEDLVQVNENVCCLVLGSFALEAQLLCNSEGILFTQSLFKVYGSSDDGIGVLCGHLLNVHPSLGRGDQHWTTCCTVIEHGNVIFVGRIPSLRKHDLRR